MANAVYIVFKQEVISDDVVAVYANEQDAIDLLASVDNKQENYRYSSYPIL